MADTYRFGGHFIGDAEVYRTPEEVNQWREQDPLTRMETAITDAGFLASEEVAAVWDRARAEVEEAERFAESSPLPDAATALDFVFASTGGNATEEAGEDERVTFGQATVTAMQHAMTADERVIVLGEDISWGGNFGQFRGLAEQFGPDRIIDMPISEATIVAVAVGAAVRGLAAGRLDELRRVCLGSNGRDRQPGFEVSLHVRWSGFGSRWCSEPRTERFVHRVPSTRRASKRCSLTSPGSKSWRRPFLAMPKDFFARPSPTTIRWSSWRTRRSGCVAPWLRPATTGFR